MQRNRFARTKQVDLLDRKALVFEIGDCLIRIGVLLRDRAVAVDGCGRITLGMVNLAENVAGKVPVFAVAVRDDLCRRQCLPRTDAARSS